MKTLVLYSSKTGNTEVAAKYIAKQIKGASLVNFAEKKPNIKKYDLIIIGSGVYFGKINTKLKKYLKDNIDDLLEKKFALFFCCDKTTDKKIKSLIDKNFKGRLQDNAIDIICASKNIETSSSYYINKMSYWFGRKENQTASEIEQSIDYDILDDFIELLSNITIIEKDKQLRNNPVPPIKDIKTRKERVNSINKPKQTHKQVVDQKEPPKNKKMKPTKAAKSAGIDNSIIETKSKTKNELNAKPKNTENKTTTTANSKTGNTNKTTTKTLGTQNKTTNNIRTNKSSVAKTKLDGNTTKNSNAKTTNNKQSKTASNSKTVKTTNSDHNKSAEANNSSAQPTELPSNTKDVKIQTTNSNSNTTVSKTKPLE